jgi:predicted RNase H-like HicB family nuclease
LRRYIALIRPDAAHGVTVTLPDFQGLVVGAERFDQAREAITSALAAHVLGMEGRGERLPAPSSFDALMADPRHGEGAAIVVFVKGERSTPEAPRSNSNDEWPEADA